MGRPSNIVVVNADYRKIAQTFYQYQKRLGYVPESYQANFNYLNEFLSWLERRGLLEIKEIQAYQIQEYYQYISHRPSKKPTKLGGGGALSPKTTHSHMRILSGFFEMLLQDEQININPTATLKFPYPKEENKERNILTQEEIKQLYEATETAQERAILSLAYGCGLRASELQNCNIEDIKLSQKILIVPKGKGNKRRVIPMSSGVVKDLSNYFYNERAALSKSPHPTSPSGKLGGDPFMLHSRGGRMQKDTYNKHLKILIERTENETIKEKEITLHSLRHSIATHLLVQGIPVEQVRIFLGHSQLETTQIYTHIHQDQLRDLMKLKVHECK